MGKWNQKDRRFFLRVTNKDGVVLSIVTKKLSRFSNSLQREEISRPGCSVYIKVKSKPGIDVHGNLVNFYNDGTYTNRKDLMKAYHAFIE